MNDAQIKHMANRFLSWRLPKPFRPDNGISFTPTQHQTGAYGDAHWPVGTNLFGPTEAEDMIRHMLEGLPGDDDVGAAEREVGRYVYRRIERLMDARAGTPEAAELAYLARIAESVEEYGEDACADHELATYGAAEQQS